MTSFQKEVKQRRLLKKKTESTKWTHPWKDWRYSLGTLLWRRNDGVLQKKGILQLKKKGNTCQCGRKFSSAQAVSPAKAPLTLKLHACSHRKDPTVVWTCLSQLRLLLCNKVPRPGAWTTAVYFLTVLEAGSPRSRCWPLCSPSPSSTQVALSCILCWWFFWSYFTMLGMCLWAHASLRRNILFSFHCFCTLCLKR